MSDPESPAASRPAPSLADPGPADGPPVQSSVLMWRKEQIKAVVRRRIGAFFFPRVSRRIHGSKQ